MTSSSAYLCDSQSFLCFWHLDIYLALLQAKLHTLWKKKVIFYPAFLGVPNGRLVPFSKLAFLPSLGNAACLDFLIKGFALGLSSVGDTS